MESRKSVRTSKEVKLKPGSEGGETPVSAMSLPEFLAEAELSHYHNALRNELKVTCVEHLKYVKEEDLEGIGMTRPEMRRLKKFYKKEHPQGTFGKLKKAIMRTGGNEPSGRSLSPSPPEHRISRPISTVVRPPGKQLIPVDAIALNKTLGEGDFGVVQQGVWTTETGEKVQVAVKSLSKEKMQSGQHDFLKEAALMQAVEHDNIVRLYGVVIHRENTLMMVTELAPMRSLLECLKEPSLRPDFPVPRLCDFAQQVCNGMSYLESKRLIHRDLAARNILVFSKSKVKISDFGLSRALGVGKDYYQSNFAVSLKLPIAWCAPECINYLKFTPASDIWAYGVTLWEFFTYGFQPWAGLNGQQILQAVDEPQCQRLEQPDLCPKEFYAVMQKCWEHNPERRPTFSQLFLTLPQIRPVQLKAVRDYPSHTVEKDHLYYKNYDIIVVLDKNPSNPPAPGMWKGCLVSGKYGFFSPNNTVPFVEPKTSPISLPKTLLTRKESGRNSKRTKLRTEMIGAPQSDLRHTGHIGYDGAVFGDVSFIGDNYDKLPVKVGTSGKMDISRGSSLSSIPRSTDTADRNGFVKGSTSEDSLDKRNGVGHSWISQESLSSQQTDFQDGYDVEDNSIFADFKMPDLASSFDFGPSFMDEVLRALDEKEKQAEAASSPAFNGRDFGDDIDPNRVDLDDKTPVVEERTPIFEERGFSTYGEKGAVSKHSAPPPLPSQPPRTDSHREKKQAKVKPMSASEEKMMEDAINLANMVDATRAQRHSHSQSPPQSPTDSGKMDFSEHTMEHAAPSLMSKLKNSIRRSPKSDRKRTFSDDRAPKGEEEPPPEAQEAYNALVVRGSEKQSTRDDTEAGAARVSVSSDAVFASDVSEPHLPEPYAASSSSSAGFPQTRLSSSSSKGSGMPQPPPRPMPKPRLDPKKTDIPVPKPRPEIVQRVEPTIRKPPDSPEVPVKEKDSSHIPVPASRKESTTETKEREREQLKRTIEIVRLESPAKDDPPTTVVPEVDTKESTPEPDSDSTHRSSISEGAESKITSLFDEDFNEPSPREVMSKLARESRMRRNLDHQRVLSGENQDLQAASVTRTRPREPSGIPVKATLATGEDLEKEDEEVDTNPLRMLRGGAIPLRTSRGAGRRTAKR
ncbi:activated Cdc42 kinase-like isoform X2 [Littorina saxatilis]|uniref:activated Cdc42 kinase-like isoform X2 n=1 Tax=Littorina saxatilis TaxID=31220 RepID=UPI0038B60A9D